MRKLKAAVIGAGFIGEAHIEAIRRLGYAEVAALVGSNAESAAKQAEKLHIPLAYGDYMEALKNDEIDVIHNCTPNHLHYIINKEALLHGKHLLSEKPLTLTSEEAKELYELAKQKNVVTGVNFTYRQFPMVQQMKAMAKDDEFGKIRIVRGEYLQDWLMYDTDYNWRMEPEYGGKTRAVGDIGSHLLDIAQYVTGRKIVALFADLATLIPTRMKPRKAQATFQETRREDMDPVDMHTEDYGSIIVKFDDGTRGVFTVSQISAGYKNGLELNLDGSKATASWRQEEPFKLWVGYRGRPNELVLRDPALMKQDALPFVHYPGGHEEGWVDSMKNQMKHFYGQIVNGGSAASDSVGSFKDGYQVMLLIDAVVKSAETGTWVEVQQVE
jgi:predicted dehydrogenase